jgi:hypothetical protein
MASPYAERFRAVVLDDAGMIDGLNDDEAQVLLDWALKEAERVGNTVTDETDAEAKQGSLTRFLAGIGRMVSRRHEHPEAGWAEEKLQTNLEHSTALNGPTLSPQQQAAVVAAINDHARPNMEVLQAILAAYTPAQITPDTITGAVENITTALTASAESVPAEQPPPDVQENDTSPKGLKGIAKKLGF